MKVSVIIPNYNGKELLAKNLPDVIKAAQYKKNKIFEIIIVDDASSDGSVKFLRENFKGLRIIQHKKNRGFSASVNMGARAAKGNLLALLNSDVLPKKDFLEQVIPHFKKKNVFAVSLHEEGYGWVRGKFENGFIGHEPGPESTKVQESFWVSGGSGVFRRDYWVKLGGMDEDLFSPFYWEDVDLCYRAAKRGWINLWEPKANVIHEHEASIRHIKKGYRKKIQERNQLLFIWKNLTSPILFKKHIVGLFNRISRHPGYFLIFLMALLKLRIVFKKRKKEKKEGRISDEAILAKFKNA